MQWLGDKDGNEFALDDETWAHIQEFHPEFENVESIQSVLLKPDWIVRSNWDRESVLYYRRIKARRFRVVVAQIADRRIKTALTTDAVKKGEIVWPKLGKMP